MLVFWPSSAAADTMKVHRRVESAKLRHSGAGVVAPVNQVHNTNKRLAHLLAFCLCCRRFSSVFRTTN